MAKDRGQVRRVLQILSPEDQETLAILHDPPRMEELIRRQDALAEAPAPEFAGDLEALTADRKPSQQALPGLRFFPAALDELAELPPTVRDLLLTRYLPAWLAAPHDGLALTQLFEGLWVAICTVDSVDYRVAYEIDPQDTGITILMMGNWASLEERLGEN